MNYAQFRWLLIALAGILVGYVVVRRRRQLVEALPEPLVEQAERFVIPWPTVENKAEEALGQVKAAVSAGAEAVGQAADKARDITAQALDSARNTAEQSAAAAQDATADAVAEPQAAAGEPTAAEEQDEAESADSSRRKVSTTHRISYAGKRYGPLPDSLVGQYVEIENSDGKLNVLHEGTTIASFDL